MGNAFKKSKIPSTETPNTSARSDLMRSQPFPLDFQVRQELFSISKILALFSTTVCLCISLLKNELFRSIRQLR